MININLEINRLLNFASQRGLIAKEDETYAANLLLDVLQADEFTPQAVAEELTTAAPVLENMLDYAAEKKLIEDTVNERDLFDTRIMNCVMPRPSEVIARFKNDYARAPKAATDNYYRLSIASNYIRKTRIDELPQSWSVLKGEMSFVGPRPERRQFVEDLEQKLPYYAERHMVKPGITGWAQINYPYGASLDDSRQKLEYDLYYAKNYTPFLDVLILLQTIRVILWPDGAR